MKIDKDVKGVTVLLIALPPHLAQELRYSNQGIPVPGDKAVCTDFEKKDFLVTLDHMEVEFSDGKAKGQKTWLPAYCFREIS